MICYFKVLDQSKERGTTFHCVQLMPILFLVVHLHRRDRRESRHWDRKVSLAFILRIYSELCFSLIRIENLTHWIICRLILEVSGWDFAKHRNSSGEISSNHIWFFHIIVVAMLSKPVLCTNFYSSFASSSIQLFFINYYTFIEHKPQYTCFIILTQNGYSRYLFKNYDTRLIKSDH